MTRQDSHHIQIKNLRTGQQEGFLLTSGDKPFTVQGVDNIATRISEGEILYSDFTNSRVFAQSEWSGGISKYWVPERIYSVIYPTLKYADAHNADLSVDGEFTIGASALLAKDFPNPTSQFSSACNGEASGVVYAGLKGSLKIWRSTDHGITWSIYLDLTTDSRFAGCDEISDIIYLQTNYAVPGHSTTDLGKNGKQLWFIAYNNSAQTGIFARKDFESNHRIVSESSGIYRNGSSPVTSTLVSNYGQNNTFSIDTTIDLNTYSLNVLWNYDVANGLARISSGVPANWYATNIIEIQEAGVWNRYEIMTNIADGTCTFLGYSGTKTNGSFNVRIWQSANVMSFKVTAGAFSTFTGGNMAELSMAGYGRMFTLGGNHYGIPGALTSNGTLGFANQATNAVQGFSSNQHTSGVDVFRIYSADGTMSSLWNTGVLSFSCNDYVHIMNYSATIFGKKLLLLQSTSYEEIFALSNNFEWIKVLGAQEYGSSVNAQGHDNLHSLASGLQGWRKDASLYNQNTVVVMPTGYMPTSGCTKPDGTGFIGSQLGTTEAGVQAKLFTLTPNTSNTALPVLGELGTIGEQSISSMVYDYDQLWIATNLDGWIYTYVSGNLLKIARMPTIDGALNNYIDSITSFGGKIVASYQNGPGVYILDPNTFNVNANPVITADILCTIPGKTPSQTFRITKLLSTGINLLIGTNDPQELYYYNRTSVGTECYITSSIYGGYISNVEKLWLYAYMRVEPWQADDGQKIRLQASFDEGATWYWLPTAKLTDMLTAPSDFTNYEHTYQAGKRNDQFTFFFPPNTLANTIQYRAWLYKGATYKPVCNHISLQFMINYKQELLFNYNINLSPNLETLDGRHVDKRVTTDKAAFLKEIWQNQDMCKFIHVDGKQYIGVPFSDDRTPGQGLVIQAQNANGARFDKENIAYNILFTLKTVANYEEVL